MCRCRHHRIPPRPVQQVGIVQHLAMDVRAVVGVFRMGDRAARVGTVEQTSKQEPQMGRWEAMVFRRIAGETFAD